jgi:curved DNA-binding protein CbpA
MTTMSGRVDLATRDAGRDVRRKHARDMASQIVQQLHRLLRIGQIHALDNDATRRQIEVTAETLRDYHVRAAEGASIFFAGGYVYFCGEPLKAGRSTYELAREIEQILQKCGGSEISFSVDVGPNDFRKFLHAVMTVMRDPRAHYADADIANIRITSATSATVLRGLGVEDLDNEQRLVRAYASAVVILRRFHEELTAGNYTLPRRIKRVAQTLVDLSEGGRPSFLGVTSVRNANHDLAGQAVNTAILAVAMARQITDDRVVLTRIAMAAMLQDVGVPRALAGQRLETDEASAPVAAMGDEADLALPAGTAGVMTALGRVNEPSIVRTVIAYEALWLRRTVRLGPVHRGLRPATLHARIVATARAYNELLTPKPGQDAKTTAEALLLLEQEASGSARNPNGFGDAADRTALRLLMAALGTLPPGILVELNTGDIAVVVEHRGSGTPVLRVVVDGSGAIAEGAADFILGSEGRHIARVVASDPSFVARRLADRDAAAARAASAPPSKPSASAPVDDATVISASPFVAAIAAPPPEQAEVLRPPMVPEGRQADVEGALARTPLPNLLVHILARGLTGSLVLRPAGGGEYALVFENSIPLKIGGDFGGARLGDLLVAAGVIDARLLAKSLENAKASKRPIGRQLVTDGVLRADKLATALERQMEDRLRALAKIVADGNYAFYRGHDFLVGGHHTEPTPIDSLAAVLLSARAWNDESRIDATLGAIEDRPLALHPASTLRRFRLTDHEKDALDAAIARGTKYRELLGDRDGSQLLRPVIYALAVTRHLDLGAADAWPLGVEKTQAAAEVAAAAAQRRSFPPIAPMKAISSKPPPRKSSDPPQQVTTPNVPPATRIVEAPAMPQPSMAPITRPSAVSVIPAPAASEGASQRVSAPPQADERRALLEERAAMLASKDPYQILGVTRSANPSDIQATFLRAAKLFHPDRLSPELSDLRETADRVFGAITEAHKLLADPERRRAHDSGGPPKDEAAEVARVLGAATNFAKAEHFLKRNEVGKALEHAKLAADADPERGEYIALLGWLGSMGTSKNAARDALATLDRALQIDNDDDRALYYRGAILKRLGKDEDAIKDFRRAVTLNPQNVDAVRELRLHGMRTERAPQSGGGLFSRWFGKK